MIVTWVTFDPTKGSTVEYGARYLDQTAYGSSTEFIDGGSEKRKMYIHRVIITGLTPGQSYGISFDISYNVYIFIKILQSNFSLSLRQYGWWLE